jgi:hypothetical protein
VHVQCGKVFEGLGGVGGPVETRRKLDVGEVVVDLGRSVGGCHFERRWMTGGRVNQSIPLNGLN